MEHLADAPKEKEVRPLLSFWLEGEKKKKSVTALRLVGGGRELSHVKG